MNKMATAVTVGVLAAAGGFYAGVSAAAKKRDIVTTSAADLKWTPLDAKAGDKGPQVSVVFGDMTKKAPIGFLLKMPAGFKPGPHTHTSDDFAVIISGNVHDFAADTDKIDEGKALTAGSTWMQPGKQAHDNHCDGPSECEVFVYMPNGFDFKPYTAPAAAPAKPAK